MKPPFEWRIVAAAAATQAVALTLGSNGYGYHRDELYFRMLPGAWGYVDQPPLTPSLARLTTHLADQPWALRLPATLAAAASVVVLALVVRELGGGRGAQGFAAWVYAFAALPLMLGHLLLTSTVDLPLLLLVVLAVLRGVRGDPRAWLWGGVVVGVTTYNRLLVTVVVAGLVLGLLVLGPRQPLRSRWPWLGALAAVLVGLPNVVYQAGHGWPQLAMGRALSDNNAAEVRAELPLLLVVMLGPPLVAVWLVGIGWLLRPERRGSLGFLVVALAVLLAFTFNSGSQPHYPVHLLSVALAAGCVPVAAWFARRPAWRIGAVALLVVNAAVSVLLALPVVPLPAVGATPLPDVGPLIGDQVGWKRYAEQVAATYRSARQPAPTAVITSNYGEAGAIARFGAALGLPHPVSGHNALYDLGGPPEGTRAVLVVGYQLDAVRDVFRSCDVADRLDNGAGVDNEEQGAPVAICRDPRMPWSAVWPRFRHLD
jgi:4-amino-4-deoxy-L-arabinose transferase-like glycosyltransferase